MRSENSARNRLAVATALAIGFGIASAAAAPPPAGARREIDHLLQYIGNSKCSFDRNGTWYDAKAALAHVRMKYDFLLMQDRISTTEDFIEMAATKSSMPFGEPYAVKCDGRSPLPSSAWLSAELARFRAPRP